MKKHAYLIMAHNNWRILEKLLLLLDDEKNDLYIHIDAKVKDFDKKIFDMVKKSQVTQIASKEVYWADYSQVDVTLLLLCSAYHKGQYSYYHLLSGADLPLKSNDERYYFFENSGKEFIGIVPKEVWYSVRRVKFYHPFLRNSYYRKCKALKVLDRLSEYTQRACRVNRIKDFQGKVLDGWTWFSITDEFCSYIISKKEMIQKMFQYTIASDELFMQTMCYNSHFRERLYDMSDLKNGSMRYIDWNRGKPYTWGAVEEDYEELISSPYMFARKFDEGQMQIVDKIFEEIDRRNKNDK